MAQYGSAVILCGGKSSRMGIDKRKIRIDGKLLIKLIAEELEKIFQEIILVSDDKNMFNDLGYKVVEDIEKGLGPAGGIYTGLMCASSQYVFFTACDMPFINSDYIKYMINIIKSGIQDCIISKNGEWIEPLYAFYSKTLIGQFKKNIEDKSLKLFEIFKNSNVYYVEESDVRSFSSNMEIFINLNYISDLDVLKRVYTGEVNIDV